MERTSTKHSARTDDVLQHETESLTRGAPVEARSEESRMAEPAAEGEFEASAVLHQVGEPVMGMPLDEVLARSEFAIALRPRAFPNDAPSLLRVAIEDNAPDWVRELLRRVDQVERYENVQQVWQAAGGHHEVRTMPHAAPSPAQPSPAGSLPAESQPSPAMPSPVPAPARATQPQSPAAGSADESYLAVAADFARAWWRLSYRTARVLTAPVRRAARARPRSHRG